MQGKIIKGIAGFYYTHIQQKKLYMNVKQKEFSVIKRLSL